MSEEFKTVRPSGEYVLIHSIAHPAGSEIKSASGILMGTRETGEIPVSGRVIAVGEDVPDEIRELLYGSQIVLPTQHMTNVPHPKLVSGEYTIEQAKQDPNKLATCHYKAVQAVYGK